ncbi:uncharacterized protein PV07_12751 [Cladophialophora immunda]|uniref:Uncharacterized protein n=1 Tax=Cladophialophora immunda TaxID=569365 RepID=A0A0D2CE31_9EURO|nr:uncharacterized protein PV07_12751 [Cladophialophora immunda]KIW21824.1 hypothetical protein PV07_12751 [Cladophialophora immunda]
MYTLKYAGRLAAQLRQAIIKFNILPAVNLLAGPVIVACGELKFRDAAWGASHDPPRPLFSRSVDAFRDNRYGGVFLVDDATPQMRKRWAKAAEKNLEKRRASIWARNILLRRYLTNEYCRTGLCRADLRASFDTSDGMYTSGRRMQAPSSPYKDTPRDFAANGPRDTGVVASIAHNFGKDICVITLLSPLPMKILPGAGIDPHSNEKKS